MLKYEGKRKYETNFHTNRSTARVQIYKNKPSLSLLWIFWQLGYFDLEDIFANFRILEDFFATKQAGAELAKPCS